MAQFRPILPKSNSDSKPPTVPTLSLTKLGEKQVCRLCLCEGYNYIRIFEPHQLGLVTTIKQCVSIDITETDSLPTTICQRCRRKLLQWVKFKHRCNKSNEFLLSKLQANIKDSSLNEEDKAGNENTADEDDKSIGDENLHEDTINTDEESLSDALGKVETGVAVKEDSVVENVEKCELQKCDVCSKEFSNLLDYLDHQKTHDGQAIFSCEKCPQSFTHRRDLINHERNHPSPCPHCGKMIGKQSMKLHLVKHTDRYMCKLCNLRFSSRSVQAEHLKALHSGLRDQICETCGKSFTIKKSLEIHQRTHSDEKRYQCKMCPYAGKTASALLIHRTKHAQKGEEVVCDVCSKMFKSMRHLKDHLRRVHSTEKKHVCFQCGLKFVDKYMLTVHQRTHTGVRPYHCELCSRAFVRADTLKEHMRTHGEGTKFLCEACSKTFTNKKGLRRHNCSARPRLIARDCAD